MSNKNTVFISYAWDTASRITEITNNIFESLSELGLTVYYDRDKNSSIGSKISKFIANIKEVDYVIVILSKQYLSKTVDVSTKVYEEWQLIKELLLSQDRVLPIIYDLEDEDIPKEISDIVYYRIKENYLEKLKEKLGFSKYNHVVSENLIDPVSGDLSHFLMSKVSEHIIKNLYPEYEWVKVSSKELINIHEKYQVKIVDQTSSNAKPLLDIETICLEGYLDHSLKGTFIFINNNVNKRFKAMINMHYRKLGKTIHFFDKVSMLSYARNHMELLDMQPLAKKDSIINVLASSVISNDSYLDFKTSFINQAEVFAIHSHSDFTTLANLNLNQIYYLHLNVYVKEDLLVNISLNDDYPIDFIAVSPVKLTAGENHITLPFKTLHDSKKFNCKLDIKFEDSWCNIDIGNFAISNKMPSRVVFSKQMKIEEGFKEIILKNLESSSNVFMNLFADGGSGKSYVLKLLIEDINYNLKENAEIISIIFSDSQERNKTILANLLFYLVTLLPFEYGSDYLSHSNKVSNIISDDILKLLIKMKSKSDITKYISDLIDVLKVNHTLNLPYYVNENKKILIIDDIHKLNTETAQVLTHLLNYIIRTQKNYIVINSSREKELNKPLKRFLKNYHTEKLKSLTHSDLKSSIESWRPEWIDYTTKSIIDSSLDGFLIFYAVDFLKELCSEKITSLMHFNEKIKEVSKKIRAPKYVENKFIHLTEYENNVLSWVYISEKLGVDFDARTVEVSTVDKLIKANLIKKSFNGLKSRHDLLISSFTFDYDDQLADYLETLYQTYDSILILSELIKCDSENQIVYVRKALKLMKEYMDSTDYSKSLVLSESLMTVFLESDLEVEFTDVEKLKVEYIYAYSLNFCGSVTKSKMSFFEISNKRNYDNPEFMSIVFESATEKLNLDYWQLDNKNIIVDLIQTRKSIEGYNYFDDENLVRAYLNTFNREMVSHLLLDNYNQAHSLLEENIRVAYNFSREDYIGFAYMDYAKGSYCIDPHNSLELLYKAESIFRKENNTRRLIDCQCEIEFLELVLDENRSTKTFESISNKLQELNLIQLYVKSLLKLLTIKVYRNENTLMRVDEIMGQITMLSPDSIDNRLTLISINLDIIKSKKLGSDLYIRNAEERLSPLTYGQSYKKIIELNRTMKKDNNISWAHNQVEDTFVLDLRIW